jgi:Flp pilus assembly protein TadG
MARLTKPQRKARRNRDRGQGLVEFGLAIPILMMLILGSIEMGRLIYTYSAVVTASREGARYGYSLGDTDAGIPHYQDCDGIRDAAAAPTNIAGINKASIQIFYDMGPGTAMVSYCPLASVNPGTRIVVRVRATYTPIVPLLPLPMINLSSVAKRTIVVVNVNPGW